MTSTYTLENTGTNEFSIPVSISYNIIELFSGGLYSSPNKAFEELVVNSYDAIANTVHVIIPPNLESADTLIWVVDNGQSMDADGLINLWRIASSTKRLPGKESADRPPIGRFGIGKLATYVLARHLTYICNVHGTYRAVTMDFSKVSDATSQETKLDLIGRTLSEEQARTILGPLIHQGEPTLSAMLFGAAASSTWTVAVMGNLTPLGQKVKLGRLKWVLSTALPLSPQFNLFINGENLKPNLEKLAPVRQWDIGNDDKVAEKQKLTTYKDPPSIEIDGIGRVTGYSQIFYDPLTGTKAEQYGRSHGIFVMVRGRLINLDDALFGLPQLSHGSFSRFRMVVQADGLDAFLRSTREAVLEADGVLRLREYILDKFNEARSFYSTWTVDHDNSSSIASSISATPKSLSRRPLLNAIRRVLTGTVPTLFLTEVPRNLSEDEKLKLLDQLEVDLDTDGLIKKVSFEPLGFEASIAVFDAAQGIIRVNELHPFYANYHEAFHNPEPFELLAVAEVLTETYLLDEGLPSDAVTNVLKRRDRFLRELVFGRQLSAPNVVALLRDAVANSKGLENAVAAALRSLGFEVSPIGGNGKPDGYASARMGVRDESGVRVDYSITYDTKSSGRERVKAHTVGLAALVRHRNDYSADYSLAVAPGFEGGDVPDSAIAKEAGQQQVTAMTVEDLSQLVLVAATRQLGFSKLQDIFRSCWGPLETHAWIERIKAEVVPPGPLPEILQTIWELEEESPDPVKFAAVAVVLRQKHCHLRAIREAEISEWVQSLRRLAGSYVTIQGDVVYLEQSPQRILQEVRVASTQLPERFQAEPMVSQLVAQPVID